MVNKNASKLKATKSIPERNLNWRGAIKGVLHLGDIHFPDKLTPLGFDELIKTPAYRHNLTFLEDFLVFCNDPILSTKSRKNTFNYYENVVVRVRETLKVAKSLELVEIKEYETSNFDGCGFTMMYCQLTAKGLETALKLQEHNDNERRFNTMQNHSKNSFYLSFFALAVAIVAVIFNYQRLDLYEKEIIRLGHKENAMIKSPISTEEKSKNETVP